MRGYGHVTWRVEVRCVSCVLEGGGEGCGHVNIRGRK